MPTVRLREVSEYPQQAQRMFELSGAWFNHEFEAPPAHEPGASMGPRFRRASWACHEAGHGAGGVHAG